VNENASGPSPRVLDAIERELPRVSRYGDASVATAFSEQIAAYENVSVEQIVLGEILRDLGLFLGAEAVLRRVRLLNAWLHIID